jgi:hypothetical protein
MAPVSPPAKVTLSSEPAMFRDPAPMASAAPVRQDDAVTFRTTWRPIVFLVSASVVALAFRRFYDGPMLPRQVFGIGSPLWLAAAIIAHFARHRGRSNDETPGGRRGARLDLVLTWISALWASLALL